MWSMFGVSRNVFFLFVYPKWQFINSHTGECGVGLVDIVIFMVKWKYNLLIAN